MSARLIGIPVDLLTEPRNGECLADRYWMIRDGRALFFQSASQRYGWLPQCNRDERTAKYLRDKLYPDSGTHVEWHEAFFTGVQWDPEWGTLLCGKLMDAAKEFTDYD